MTRKHVLIMFACCLTPLAAVAAIWIFHLPLTSVVYGLLLLACPISHLLMMKFIGHDLQEDGHHTGVAKNSS
jgi:hypothetical protein